MTDEDNPLDSLDFGIPCECVYPCGNISSMVVKWKFSCDHYLSDIKLFCNDCLNLISDSPQFPDKFRCSTCQAPMTLISHERL